jgi:hypothetical protein
MRHAWPVTPKNLDIGAMGARKDRRTRTGFDAVEFARQ